MPVAHTFHTNVFGSQSCSSAMMTPSQQQEQVNMFVSHLILVLQMLGDGSRVNCWRNLPQMPCRPVNGAPS